VDAWFDQSEALRRHRLASGGWSIDEVLEHITLTNHYLLMTLSKQLKVAKRRGERGEASELTESDLQRLQIIGRRGSFQWDCPAHMRPTGEVAAEQLRSRLHEQLGRCLILLQNMSGGVGALVTVTMTVNALGKIDLYQWLYFLAQHAHRHLQQMTSIQADYERQGEPPSAPTIG
jgi:hypothetical protein